MIIIIVLILLVIFLIFCNNQNNHTIYGKIGRTILEKKRGLMYRKHKLKYNEGMLFNYTYKKNSMWMKNTYIPLDVIFLDSEMNIVGYVKDTVPLSLKSISIDKKSNNVLEMNSGSIDYFDMKIGDKINFTERELS
tara:strand:+ start:56 stop:463 length:408 start_codon:yes stop_codon:yes gene_type:complete